MGSTKLDRNVALKPRTLNVEPRTSLINVAVIGAGGFAQSVHLPNLRKLSSLYNIYAIGEKIASNAKQVAKRFKAAYCTSDYQESLKDENVDMVLITTRHNLHARIAMEAAKAGKAVFSEKPMALKRESSTSW